jgi:hypothetical protein
MAFPTKKLLWLTQAIVITAVLAVLSATTLSAQPREAPSEVQDNVLAHAETTNDIVVTSTANVVLLQVTVTLSTLHNHTCLVTASGEVSKNYGFTATYIFGLSVDQSLVQLTTSNRRVEFVSTDVEDVEWESVATTAGWAALTGAHTFYFLARKQLASYDNATVTNASMIVVCEKS